MSGDVLGIRQEFRYILSLDEERRAIPPEDKSQGSSRSAALGPGSDVSLEKLLELLKRRFGGADQEERFRMEYATDAAGRRRTCRVCTVISAE